MHEEGFPFQRSSISNLCTLYSGPIEASDTHEFYILRHVPGPRPCGGSTQRVELLHPDSPPSLQCASLKRVFGPPLALRRLSRSVRRGTMTILTKQCPWRHPRMTGPILQKTALKWRDMPHSRMSWSGFSPRPWAISAEPQENVILFWIIYVCMLLVKKNSSEYTANFEWKKDGLWVQTV